LIISNDVLNSGPGELVFVIPMTSRDRGIPLHVKLGPPETALLGVILCDQLRSISRERLKNRIGAAKPSTMREVEDRLRIIMNL
jgi:mRNA interferase MazF